ncbi:MAG: HAD family phosphatase [Bacteroidales bacterium]|nr:HAD family phosphatase [Bacteroidales bacterium]MCF8403773.1 HAD family phosphatase [Bacteroidales bacterium]
MESKIKNIILDFGGVILNIDHKKVELAFKEIGIDDFDTMYGQALQSNLFQNFEKGNITDAQFRESLRKFIQLEISDEKLDNTWNTIILDYPPERIRLLKSLTKKYRLFLLSNTNIIHYNYYIPKFNNQFGFDFNSLFEKTYWSFKMGLRKPDPSPYELILNENNLMPEETLFIDDSLQNIEAAEGLNIMAFHLKPSIDLTDVFVNGILNTHLIINKK